MTYGPLVDQRPLIPNGSEDCFESCLYSVLVHLGHSVDIHTILADHNGATDTATALRMCLDFGLKGVTLTQGGFDNNDKIVIALFHDDVYAEPNSGGPFEHYSVVYTQDILNVYMMNPFGGRLETVPLTKFNPASIAALVIPVTANRGDTLNLNTKLAFTRLAYLACLGREPGGNPREDLGRASAIADDGSNVDTVISQIADSPEAVSWRAHLHATNPPPAPGLTIDQVKAIVARTKLAP